MYFVTGKRPNRYWLFLAEFVHNICMRSHVNKPEENDAVIDFSNVYGTVQVLHSVRKCKKGSQY